MLSQTLYKYRGLSNFRNFADIILNKRLYAAKYNDLNDPLEGHFIYDSNLLSSHVINKLARDKGLIRICSLSKKNDVELMWSHYAEGQSGVAIGLKFNIDKYKQKEIEYTDIKQIDSSEINSLSAYDLLSKKLKVWRYEEEVRVFCQKGNFINNIKIEEIVIGRKVNRLDLSLIKKIIASEGNSIKLIDASEIL